MVLLAATAMILASQLPPATPPPRDQPRSTRSEARVTATIRGLVTDRESGAPLSGVLVLVVPVTADGDLIPEGREQQRRLQHSRRTGADGSYEIRDIPPGSYRVTFIPSDSPGLHLTQNFGDEGPATPLRLRPPARLTLRAGETKNDVSAALSRGLAIEGRVIDERGEPVANADVTVRVADRSGHGAAPGRPRVTDDRGAFRVFGLAAGAYRVCALPGWESVPTSGNTDRLVGACHPEDTETGRSVTLTSRDVSGIVIQLRRSRTFMVKGIAIDSSGAPIERGYVNLMSAGAPVSPTWNIEFSGGGAFIGRSVPPGEYLLLVWAHQDSGNPDARNGETGYVSLRVDAADLDSIIVTTARPGRVSGRIVVDAKAVLRPTTLRITSEVDQRLLPVSLIPGLGAPVADDWSFEVRDLWGPRLLNVSGLPKGWIVKAIVYRGQDVTDTGVEFKTGGEASAVEVVITNHAGSIAGRVTGAEGTVADAMVVAVSSDPQRRRSMPMVVHTPVREDQTFDSGAIRPGDYIVAAVDAVFARLLTAGDRAALDRLVEAGERLTVRADERHSQDLRVILLR